MLFYFIFSELIPGYVLPVLSPYFMLMPQPIQMIERDGGLKP